MFKSIETTEVIFKKKPKVRNKRANTVRCDTPRPTDEDVLRIMTGDLVVDPVAEDDKFKKNKPGA